MNDLSTAPAATPRPTARHRNGHTMLLLDEALARCRRREAEAAAREHALARSLTAGRRWARIARYAQRRAARARAAAGGTPADAGTRPVLRVV